MMQAASAYQEAVSGGRYGKGSGLLGKYDNVRVYWEDWVTGYFIIPSLEKLVEQARQEGRGLRVLDLGCGSGDGYDLLTTLPSPRAGWVTGDTRLLPPSGIEYYLGIDLNEERQEQQFTSFPLRLMTRAEVRRVVEKAVARSGTSLVVEQFSDRSLFIGRHMETQQYNQYARPLRRAVNSLLEPGIRTDLGDLGPGTRVFTLPGASAPVMVTGR